MIAPPKLKATVVLMLVVSFFAIPDTAFARRRRRKPASLTDTTIFTAANIVVQAGEKRTAEVRGRLGKIQKTIQGELIIGIIVSEGLPPGTHSIRTEIQPRPSRKPSTR